MTMSTLKRCVLAALAVASMAVMLTGCSGGSGESSDTIKIGANLELTGNSASYGTSAKNGIEMAVKEINDAGGLMGKKSKSATPTTAAKRRKQPTPCRSC